MDRSMCFKFTWNTYRFGGEKGIFKKNKTILQMQNSVWFWKWLMKVEVQKLKHHNELTLVIPKKSWNLQKSELEVNIERRYSWKTEKVERPR